jgi:hypothetical protein
MQGRCAGSVSALLVRVAFDVRLGLNSDERARKAGPTAFGECRSLRGAQLKVHNGSFCEVADRRGHARFDAESGSAPRYRHRL